MPEIAATKLQPPRRRTQTEERPWLLRDVAPPECPLTVIVAPAGWGKTTLLAQWCDSNTASTIASIALDRLDDDPVRFWTAVVESLRAAGIATATDVPATPQAAGPELWHVVVPGLIGDLAKADQRVVILIDDYHFIGVDHIHDGLRYLVERLPTSTQLVLATRQEPPLGLARLRAAGTLAEVRADRLALDDTEIAAHVQSVAGVELSAQDVVSLRQRSEGWPAGVHLAALSLRHREDPSAFIASFAGDHHHVADYLTSDVFARVPRDMSDFLRGCSVLEEFDIDLCRAVTDADDVPRYLAEAERLGLFVMALDDVRGRYRMHALVSSWLQHRLSLESPEELRGLHLRAARWYEASGDPARAGDHAVAGGDLALLGRLVARYGGRLMEEGHVLTLGRWLAQLPEERVLEEPILALTAAATAATSGDLVRAERLVDAAAVAAQAAPGSKAGTETEIELAVTRATISLLRRDLTAAERLAGEAARMDVDKDRERYGSAHVLWATAQFWLDRCEAASDVVEKIQTHVRAGFVRRQAAGVQAAALVELGDAPRAERLARSAVADAAATGAGSSPETALSLIALGAALTSRAELAEGEQHLVRGIELSRQWNVAPQTVYGLLHLARLRLGQGRVEDAGDLIRDAAPVVESARVRGLLARVLGRTERMLAAARRKGSAAMVEVLSDRETDVLRLLPSALSQREIGARLGVSLDTVKSHTRNLYGKLGVSSRSEAVARARELDLL